MTDLAPPPPSPPATPPSDPSSPAKKILWTEIHSELHATFPRHLRKREPGWENRPGSLNFDLIAHLEQSKKKKVDSESSCQTVCPIKDEHEPDHEPDSLTQHKPSPHLATKKVAVRDNDPAFFRQDMSSPAFLRGAEERSVARIDKDEVGECVNPIFYRRNSRSLSKDNEKGKRLLNVDECDRVVQLISAVCSLLVLLLVLVLVLVLLLPAVNHSHQQPHQTSSGEEVRVERLKSWWIHQKHPGKSMEVERVRLVGWGMRLEVMSWGASMTSLVLQDGTDIVLGFDSIQGYLGSGTYMGSTVGRVANRIYRATFSIKNRTYHLDKNDGRHHLHGGFKGLDKQNWKTTIQNNSVVFSTLSLDGEGGYPGDVLLTVVFSLEEGSVRVQMGGVSTAPTPLNLANHAYFNLAGHKAGPQQLYQHRILIDADSYTPVSDELIPTGSVLPVEGTVFDLRRTTRLGDIILNVTNKNSSPAGFDHNFVVGRDNGRMRRVALVAFKHRTMEVESNQPGLQFYTGNMLPGAGLSGGKEGAVYVQHGGMCLETQNFPDFVNNDNFPEGILYPGYQYSHTLLLRFSVQYN